MKKLFFETPELVEMVMGEFGLELDEGITSLEIVLNLDGSYALWGRDGEKAYFITNGEDEDGLIAEFAEYASRVQ